MSSPCHSNVDLIQNAIQCQHVPMWQQYRTVVHKTFAAPHRASAHPRQKLAHAVEPRDDLPLAETVKVESAAVAHRIDALADPHDAAALAEARLREVEAELATIKDKQVQQARRVS